MTPAQIAEHIRTIPHSGPRRVIALAGPPASGKSTLAEQIAALDPSFAVVPMDGFHLDNAILSARDLLPRKGAPQTFDADGFIHLIKRLKTEAEVVYPLFDRSLDKSIAGAGCLGPAQSTVIVEGNYLLLDQDPWRDLAPLWDYAIRLDVPEATLRTRLLARWRDHGYDAEQAALKADANDIPNALLVGRAALPCDLVL